MNVSNWSGTDAELAEVARRSYRAYVDKDRAAMEQLIAEDFHFTSPLDNRLDRKTYFERCWPNSQWIAEFEFIGVVPDNDRVYVTYIGRIGPWPTLPKYGGAHRSRREDRRSRSLFRLVTTASGPAWRIPAGYVECRRPHRVLQSASPRGAAAMDLEARSRPASTRRSRR